MGDIYEAIASLKNESSMDSKGLLVPKRWLHCPRKSSLIVNKIVVCKTMLDERYNSQVPEECRFNWNMLSLSVQSSFKKRIGMIIDLTNTDRFYDKKEVENDGCKYVKFSCRGFGECPTVETTNEFIRTVESFSKAYPQHLIAIHCTHGFNRSGFLVVAYLCNAMNWDLRSALKVFAEGRSPGIYKADYLKEIAKRFGYGDDEIPEAPELPDWHKEYDDTDRGKKGRNGKNGKNVKLKDILFMDGQVTNVDTVRDPELVKHIQSTVSKMCEWKGRGFPGSQPVSMDKTNIMKLTEKSYGVTWKADGQRYLMLIQGKDEIYMLDRDYAVYKVNDMTFPRRKAINEHIFGTLLDGEMIIDNYQGCNRGRYLVYDIIRFEDQEVCKTHFNTRLLCIRKEIVGPRNDLFQKSMLDKVKEPFSIRAKEFWNLTQTKKILDINFSKQLLHQIDGLIFQPFDDFYIFGQCREILKWKPPELNSIDFKLVIRMENREGMLRELVGQLMVGGLNVPFGQIKVTKELRNYDNKIVECSWDPDTKSYKFLRERTDKSFPNKFETANSVMETIRHPVTEAILYHVIDNQRFDLAKMKVRHQVGSNMQINPPPNNHAGAIPQHVLNGNDRPPSRCSTSSSSSASSIAPASRKRPMPSPDDPLCLNQDLHEYLKKEGIAEHENHFQDRRAVGKRQPLPQVFPAHDPLGLNIEVPAKKARRH